MITGIWITRLISSVYISRDIKIKTVVLMCMKMYWLSKAAPKSDESSSDWFILNNKWICCFVVGEPVADLAGDRRRRGVGGGRVLRNRPKPCVIRMQWISFVFFTCLHICPFPLSLPFYSPLSSCLWIFSNHCYNSFHYEMFCQIKPASPPLYINIVFMLSFLIFNLIWCPAADVLYISILGYVFFNSRQ